MFKNSITLVVFGSLVLFSTPSLAVKTFDCKTAAVKVGKIICSDKQLSTMDDMLSDAYDEYAKLIQVFRDEDKNKLLESLKQDHFNWMKNELIPCQTAKCAEDVYTQRTEVMYKMTGRLEMQIQEAKTGSGGVVEYKPRETKAVAAAAQSPQPAAKTSAQPALPVAGRDYAWIGVSKDLGEGSSYSLITCKSKSDVFLFWTSFQEALQGNKESAAMARDMNSRDLCTVNNNIGQSPNELNIFIKGKKPIYDKRVGYINHELEAFILSKRDGETLTRLGWITAYDLQYDKNTREFVTYEFNNGKFSRSSR